MPGSECWPSASAEHLLRYNLLEGGSKTREKLSAMNAEVFSASQGTAPADWMTWHWQLCPLAMGCLFAVHWHSDPCGCMQLPIAFPRLCQFSNCIPLLAVLASAIHTDRALAADPEAGPGSGLSEALRNSWACNFYLQSRSLTLGI